MWRTMAAEPEDTDKNVKLEALDELCEFWEWALATRRRLERRVEELSDPEKPHRRAEELLEDLREYAIRPLDETFEQEILGDLLPYAHEETQKDLGTRMPSCAVTWRRYAGLRSLCAMPTPRRRSRTGAVSTVFAPSLPTRIGKPCRSGLRSGSTRVVNPETKRSGPLFARC